VQLIPDVHWVLVGEGERRDEIERERTRLGLEPRVHLLGFREEVRELIAQFTLFVLPSAHEGMGTSLLEAQALGVPIIASRVGGIPEVVKDGMTGRLVPVGDAEALASAVIETLQHPEEGARWAARARTEVRALSAERMVERTIEVYQSVLSTRAARGQAGEIPLDWNVASR
jgi:glycosyltransferase involved in cell wall biosynthesis